MSVYLPTYYGTSTSYDDFFLTIGELEGFIETQSFDRIIIGGDFNVDFNRPSGRRDILSNFMSDHSLAADDSHYHHSIGLTYERDDGSARSWPDHFLCDSATVCNVKSCAGD